ncbi:MAG: glutamate--tRNA ligase family protein [Owenweeksia sp.]|nr:glutamate--tRNA ligase family protein [Owenweeksia sp.]
MAIVQPKTRLAPTPSGFLHLGNAFNFILTALVAYHEGATTLLRIDDQDQARYRSHFADDIFRTLHLLKIEPQQGPQSTTELEKSWSQQLRLPLYHRALQSLRQNNQLFACNCSRRQVEAASTDGGYSGTCQNLGLSMEAESTAWRIHTNKETLHIAKWPLGVGATDIPAALRHFVVRKKDGLPAYQLTSVADDLHFGINLVVRGADLYPSTIAQLYLARQLRAQGFENIRWLHHPLLTAEDGLKISKSTERGARQLSQIYLASEIYRHFCQWLKLPEVESLAELKELNFHEKIARFSD